jgi:hypothetical protein
LLVHEVSGGGHASTEQLSALLDDRAEPEERTFLAGHVDQCAACARELADLDSVRDLLRRLPVHLPPRDFTIPVVEAVPARPRFRRLIPLTRALGTIAAALCVLLFAADALRLGSENAAPTLDGSAAFQITTAARATAPPAKPAEAANSAAPAVTARPADAPKLAEAPKAAEVPRPAEAAKPAAPAPAAAAPPAPAPPASASGAAQAQAAGQAAARAPLAATSPAAQGTVTALAATQPPVAPVVATVAATLPAQSAGASVGDRSVPAQRSAPPAPIASPWFSPTRLTALAFAVLAAVFLAASVMLSRKARASVVGGGQRPRA